MIHRWMLQQIFPKIKVVHFWLIFPPWFAQGARYQQWSPAWLGGICPMIFPVAAAVWLTMATFTLAAELRVLRVPHALPHAQHLPGPSQRLVGGGRENPLGEWDLTWKIGSFHGIQWYSQIGDNIFPNFPIFRGWHRAPGIFFRARAKTWCWWNWETSQIRYIPRPSKGLRFGTPIECSLRGYVSTPLSRTKKTQQDMVITMLIAPFLGDELNNKNFDFGKFRRANDTRLPGSDTLPTRIKGRQNDTP